MKLYQEPKFSRLKRYHRKLTQFGTCHRYWFEEQTPALVQRKPASWRQLDEKIQKSLWGQKVILAPVLHMRLSTTVMQKLSF